MLSDAQRAVLEPLVEACRPKGKTPPLDLRRTLSAILCGATTGPSGAPYRLNLVRGGGRPRSSFVGPALVLGSACSPSFRSEGSDSEWCSSTAPTFARTTRQPGRHEGGISSRARPS